MSNNNISLSLFEREKEYLINLYNEIYIIVEHGKIKREYLFNEMLNILAIQKSSLTNLSNISNSINVKLSVKIDDGWIIVL